MDGISATFFYLTSYALMNLGAFAVLIYLQGKADAAEDLDDLAGIAKGNPLPALLMAICLFSLIGMPLTMGFLGKFYLIQQALVTGHTVLAVITVINAAIAAAYYLKIIAAMYLREPLYPFATRTALPIKVTALVCTVAVVAFFFLPRVVLEANNTPREPVLSEVRMESEAPAAASR
jgi:NADH-quinone oxidoreductase subunit N